jgi:hypothetical protein
VKQGEIMAVSRGWCNRSQGFVNHWARASLTSLRPSAKWAVADGRQDDDARTQAGIPRALTL